MSCIKNAWYIEIEAGPNCSFYHGMNTTFSGTYKHSTELVINRGYLDEIDLNEIERLTGRHLPVFLNNFQQTHCEQDDYGNDLTIITAGVKGFYTTMESIVILDKHGTIWCACLDPEAEVVRYFTNGANEIESKPEAMQEWLSRFLNRKVIVNDSDISQSSKS